MLPRQGGAFLVPRAGSRRKMAARLPSPSELPFPRSIFIFLYLTHFIITRSPEKAIYLPAKTWTQGRTARSLHDESRGRAPRHEKAPTVDAFSRKDQKTSPGKSAQPQISPLLHPYRQKRQPFLAE